VLPQLAPERGYGDLYAQVSSDKFVGIQENEFGLDFSVIFRPAGSTPRCMLFQAKKHRPGRKPGCLEKGKRDQLVCQCAAMSKVRQHDSYIVIYLEHAP
jgi:hypothetical protein